MLGIFVLGVLKLTLVEFVQSNLSGDPLIDAVCLGILFTAFIEFYHIIANGEMKPRSCLTFEE